LNKAAVALSVTVFVWARADQPESGRVYNVFMPFRVQGNANAAKRGRTPPPEETFEEASFLKALGEKQKPVSVKLMDGQTVSGWIEYYDKHMVRLTREGAPNLFIFKHEIMYIAEDGGKKK
jgi:host factor-I protein